MLRRHIQDRGGSPLRGMQKKIQMQAKDAWPFIACRDGLAMSIEPSPAYADADLDASSFCNWVRTETGCPDFRRNRGEAVTVRKAKHRVCICHLPSANMPSRRMQREWHAVVSAACSLLAHYMYSVHICTLRLRQTERPTRIEAEHAESAHDHSHI
jgi:hypothetical protein